MTGALSTLVADILDYAGLFPPAGLDMPQAVAEYERHLLKDEAGMLANFVCPVDQLDDLARSAKGRTWKLSILGTSSESPSDALILDDMRRIAGFLRANRGFTMSALELRVPSVLLETPSLKLFPRAVEALVPYKPPLKLFYELGWGAPWGSVLPALKQGQQFSGAKIRTGGLKSSAFPTSEQIAVFLIAAREAGIAWKATAGLHHPVRRFQSEVETKMHGFLNVFLGAALALKGGDEAGLVGLLNEEDATAFRFSEETVSWRDHVLDRELLSRTRGEFALSFGSCSYQEPIDDLKTLGLL